MDGPGDFDRKRLIRLGEVDRFYVEAEIDAILEDLSFACGVNAEHYDQLADGLVQSAEAFDGGRHRAHLVAAGMRERARSQRETKPN